MKALRKSAVAGLFYPGEPAALKNSIQSFLSASEATSQTPIRFLIVPHAGYSYSGRIAGEGFAEVTFQQCRRVVLIGPSHRHYFKGITGTTETAWETPLGETAVAEIDHPQIDKNAQVHKNEHSLEVQLPFVQYLLPEATIVPLLLSGPSSQAQPYSRILDTIDTEDTLWVISSDFNHTGPGFQHDPRSFGYPSGEAMDRKAIEYITSGEIESLQHFLLDTAATICGALPILTAMHLLKQKNLGNFIFKAYDCSGNQTGDINSVGYAALYR